MKRADWLETELAAAHAALGVGSTGTGVSTEEVRCLQESLQNALAAQEEAEAERGELRQAGAGYEAEAR